MRYSGLTLLTAFLLSGAGLRAQTAPEQAKPGWGSMDYAIPASPAFKLLSNEPSNILRPTSIRTAAISIGNYLKDSGSVIPKNLGIEISPFSFGNLSLREYHENNLKRFWYRTKFSFGTSGASGGSYTLAEGVRFTLFDNTDLNNDAPYNHYLAELAEKEAGFQAAAFRAYAHEHELRPQDVGEKYGKDSILTQSVDSIRNKLIDAADLQAINDIASIRNKVMDTLWNKSIMQLGFAASQQSPDSLVKHAKTNKLAGFLTLGLPVSDKGQVLFGVSDQMTDSAKWTNSLSIGSRLYYGENKIKGYLEFQYSNVQGTGSWYSGLGFDLNISSNLWCNIVLAVNQAAKGSLAFVPGFSLSFGTSGKKK